MPDPLHEPFMEVIFSRTEDVQKALIHAASHLAQAYLKDFDWRLEVERAMW